MDIEVVVPWRPGCGYRSRSWRWVRQRYACLHPSWNVTETRAPHGTWCKAAAVNPAIARSAADIIVQADADVWTDGLVEAVKEVEAGAPWAVPHNLVHRLSEVGTQAVLDGDDWRDQPLTQHPYAGFIGGGIVVARCEVFQAVPLDMRFKGWGQEDEVHGAALCAIRGTPWRGKADLVHLWHPPQKRMSRRKGSDASWALRQRYWACRNDKQGMERLLEEAR
jgi:hypothetical protein